MIAELVAGGEAVYPLQLGELLAQANELAEQPAATLANTQGSANRELQAIR